MMIKGSKISFGNSKNRLCIVWFCGDREELVILPKMEAENNMAGDGKKKKKGICFPSQEEKVKTSV